MYAIVRSGATQQKVAVGDVIEIDKVTTGVGESVTLPVVLLVDGEQVTADASRLSGASVTAEVVGASKGPKITILKFKNKTGYRRRQGHRPKHTRVRVTGIDNGSGTVLTESAAAREPKAAATKAAATKVGTSKTAATKTAATKTAATKTAASDDAAE